ncbi:MAG: hypothetical protein HN347_12425 [Bacteroidetes bacterium]|jgi:hypothetical protein|nr:hypothetical protein [Bacteroidota bacterium]
MSVVSEIRTLAESVTFGHEFVYGLSEYINAEAGDKDLQDKDMIALEPVTFATSYSGGVAGDEVGNTTLSYCVKNDGTYESTLDETNEQKFDRRLDTMKTAIKTFIDAIACLDNFEIQTVRIIESINQLDENTDMLVAQLQFIYYG